VPEGKERDGRVRDHKGPANVQEINPARLEEPKRWREKEGEGECQKLEEDNFTSWRTAEGGRSKVPLTAGGSGAVRRRASIRRGTEPAAGENRSM